MMEKAHGTLASEVSFDVLPWFAHEQA